MNRNCTFALTIVSFLCVTGGIPPQGVLAQQPRPVASARTNSANPPIDLPDVVAEVKAAYDRYNRAVNTNDVAILNESFRNDTRTIRYGNAEHLYGYKEIEAYRAANRALCERTLSNTVITTYGRDFAVASTLTHRSCAPGKVGRQMQSWVRFPDGWRVVAAHVSTIDEPQAGRP